MGPQYSFTPSTWKKPEWDGQRVYFYSSSHLQIIDRRMWLFEISSLLIHLTTSSHLFFPFGKPNATQEEQLLLWRKPRQQDNKMAIYENRDSWYFSPPLFHLSTCFNGEVQLSIKVHLQIWRISHEWLCLICNAWVFCIPLFLLFSVVVWSHFLP